MLHRKRIYFYSTIRAYCRFVEVESVNNSIFRQIDNIGHVNFRQIGNIHRQISNISVDKLTQFLKLRQIGNIKSSNFDRSAIFHRQIGNIRGFFIDKSTIFFRQTDNIHRQIDNIEVV